MTTKPLTPKQEAFAGFIAEGYNQSEAYRKAYNASKMKQDTINHRASELARGPVAARIQEIRDKAAERSEFKAADVLKRWVAIATADPAELVRFRRLCCRYCHSPTYEALVTKIEHEQTRSKDDAPGENKIYFDPTLQPNKNCPNCFGEGLESVYIEDTRKLSESGKLLYAGIKQNREGVQVLMRDQDDALRNIAKFLGMLNNKVELSGPNGAPLKSVIQNMPIDSIEAAKIYQEYITK